MQHLKLIKISLLFLVLVHLSSAEMYKSHLSDRWYPSTKKKLQKTLGLLVEQSDQYASYDFSEKKIVAMLVPHAAYQYCGGLAVNVFKHLHPGQFDRIIILASCHDAIFHGIALPGLMYKTYKTPLGIIDLDRSILNRLVKKSPLFFVNHEIHEFGHGIEVQIPLIQRYCAPCKIVPMFVGSLSSSEMDQVAEIITTCMNDRTLLLVSSDFVQYQEADHSDSFVVSGIGSSSELMQQIDFELIEKIHQQDPVGFAQIVDSQNVIVRGKNPLLLLLNMMHKKYINVRDCFLLGHESCCTQQASNKNCVSYIGMIMSD